MSLRDLMVSVNFDADVNALSDIDSYTDSVADNLTNVGTTGDSSLGDVESAAISASGEMSEMNDASKGLFETLGDNWGKITVGAGAAGIAIEKLGRNQAKLTETTNRGADAIGVSSEEYREMATEISNVTFPLEEALDLMETGRQQGLESAEALQEYATFWDTVGDATGLAGPKLGEASAGLRAVGIAAGEEQEALSAFGYITESTTGNVDEFLQFLERTGPQLNEMGMDVDDTAAMLGILEHEFGMSGRTARQEFRKAVNESDGDLNNMMETLGVSEEMFGEYSDAVANSSDVIQNNADNHAESYTAMEKMQHWVSELTYTYGPFIEALTMLTPLLIAIGPIIKGVTLAKQLFNAALWASPITWIVIGIVALIAVVILLWKNWDQVTEWISEVWNNLLERGREIFASIGETITNFVTNAWNKITEIWDNIITWLSETWSGMVESVKGFFGDMWNSIVQTGEDIWTSITGLWDEVMGFFEGIDLMQIGKDIIQGLINGISSMIGAVKDKVSEVASSISDGVKGFFGISSPSRLMMEYGGDIGEGLQIGLDKSAMEVAESARRLSESSNPMSSSNSSGTVSRGSSNISIGDIHVTVNGDTNESKASITGKRIGRELRREIMKVIDDYNSQELAREV